MSGSFSIDDGQIVITNGARTVATTDGTLINLTPDTSDYEDTISVAFPDFTKDYAYNWWWISDYSSLANQYGMDNGCVSSISIPAQEWSDTTVLASAPAGADFAAIMIKINRTTAPANDWGGNSIDVLPKQGEWIPFSGSVLVEAEVGMARAFSIYLDGGNLVLHRQQSVSVPPGGWGLYGNQSGGNPQALANDDARGGEWVYGTAQGIPVHVIQVRSDAGYQDTATFPFPPNYPRTNRRGQANACSLTATTNYSSTYTVDVVARFGRRS